MSAAALELINQRMIAAGIPYALIEWGGKSADENSYYFVGEYSEIETAARMASGKQRMTVTLRGFTAGTWSMLEEAKRLIEQTLPGTFVTDDGEGIAIVYDYGMQVPTYDAALKSIKINLTVYTWRTRQ